MMLAPLLGAAAVVDRSGDARGNAGVARDPDRRGHCAVRRTAAAVAVAAFAQRRHAAADEPRRQGACRTRESACLDPGGWPRTADRPDAGADAGQNAGGWHWSLGAELDSLLPWRWPRVLSALAAGMMLAVAGTLIQKLTGNPMASPEVLGISSGAAFGVVMMLFMVPGDAFVCCPPAAWGGRNAADHHDRRRPRRFLDGTHAARRYRAQHRLYHRHLPAVGQRRSAYGGLLTWLSGSTYSVERRRCVPRWWPPA